MQLYDLNSKPHGGQSLRYLIDRAIGTIFYPNSGYYHHILFCIDQFHKSTHFQSTLKNNTNTKKHNA